MANWQRKLWGAVGVWRGAGRAPEGRALLLGTAAAGCADGMFGDLCVRARWSERLEEGMGFDVVVVGGFQGDGAVLLSQLAKVLRAHGEVILVMAYAWPLGLREPEWHGGAGWRTWRRWLREGGWEIRRSGGCAGYAVRVCVVAPRKAGYTVMGLKDCAQKRGGDLGVPVGAGCGRV